MSWVVIIDNGEGYSDHEHTTVCTCADEATAKKAVAAFDAWRDEAAAQKRETQTGQLRWLIATPCPFPRADMAKHIPSTIAGYTAAAIEVPEWAEGKP